MSSRTLNLGGKVWALPPALQIEIMSARPATAAIAAVRLGRRLGTARCPLENSSRKSYSIYETMRVAHRSIRSETLAVSFHNPDQYMAALRTIIAQGRKRVGILVGAGAPAGMKKGDGTLPLIPAVAGLTSQITSAIGATYKSQIDGLKKDLKKHDIETLLSRIRSLSTVIGATKIHDLDGDGYKEMAETICSEIGKIVNVRLPTGTSPYGELVSWITGASRAYPVEIFTTNYDLLFEEAFERAQAPYFDGFSGSREAFFDPASVSDDGLSPRWSKLWKLHGSLGWKANDRGEVVRTGQADATHLIFPEHLKYDQTQKAPYAALLDRLRSFLASDDTLLVSIGFSYADAHIAARISEALAANPASSVFAFQYQSLENESHAVELATKRSNFSVYARDKAVINGVAAAWSAPGDLPTKDWGPIRDSYWAPGIAGGAREFQLGAIDAFARFFANSRSPQSFDLAPAIAAPPTPASAAAVL